MWDISSEAISLSAFSLWGVVGMGYLSQWPIWSFSQHLYSLVSFRNFPSHLILLFSNRRREGRVQTAKAIPPQSSPAWVGVGSQRLSPGLAEESFPSLHPREPSAAICGGGRKGIQTLTIFWVSVLILQLKWWGYFSIETWAKFSFVSSPDRTLGSELGFL